MKNKLMEVIWMGDSRKSILKFPIDVKKTIGHVLYFAQRGDRHPNIKMMRGLGGGVYEIIEDHRSGTYRAIYTVQYEKRVYVLHAFQKKSKSGIATPLLDIEVVKKRLKGLKEIENDRKNRL